MKNVDGLVKKLTSNVQQRCAERIELAAKASDTIHKPQDAIENRCISSIMKRNRGL